MLIFDSPLGSVEQGTGAEESWPGSGPDCGTAAVWEGSDRCSRTDWKGEARSVGTDPGYTPRSGRLALPGRAQSRESIESKSGSLIVLGFELPT